jgi:signal peptidase II
MEVIPASAAVRSVRTAWAAAGIAVAVLAADQVSKSLVLALHPVGGPGTGTGTGWVAVRLVRNTGASGGIASGHPVLVTLTALAVTVAAAALALRASGRVTVLCLAAVLGGAAGNLADRLLRAPGFGRSAVVDWIHFAGRGGSMDVADLAIQFGVLGALGTVVAAELAAKRRRPGRTASLPGDGPGGRP